MTNEELEVIAINKLRKVFSPLQLYWVAVAAEERDELGFGKIEVTWHNGHPDTLFNTKSMKLTMLPVPTTPEA